MDPEVFRRVRSRSADDDASLRSGPERPAATRADLPGSPIFQGMIFCSGLAPVCAALALLTETHPSSLQAWLGATAIAIGTMAFAFLVVADRRLRHLEAARHESAQRESAARDRLERLARASLALEESLASLPGEGISSVLQTIADQARRLVSAEFAIVELEADLPGTSGWGVPPKELAAASGSAPGRATAMRVAARTEGYFRIEGLAGAAEFSMFQRAGRLDSLLGMPITFRGRTIGFLLVGNQLETSRFDENDEDTTRMLAGRAGIALEAARLYQRAALEKTFLEGVIDEMPDGITLVDARGRVIAHNRAARRMAREDGDETDSAGNQILLDARTPEGERIPWSALPVFGAAARGERVLRREMTLVRGSLRVPVLASAVPLVDSRRQRVGAVAVYQDITTIRELERMRDEWSSLIAHDLRQPIGTMILTTDLLRQRHIAVTEGDLRALDRLETAASRLSGMIDDLLDVSRLDARNLALNCHPIALEDLLFDCADRMGAQTGASIRVVLDGGVPPLYADPARLDQVLCNLLSNAAKYGLKGSPVSIEATSRAEGVEVRVTNFGAGIEPAEIEQLFARFHRTDSARRSSTPGIGLGLYICKGLVEAHGGRIFVESVPGERTTFGFVLPARLNGIERDAS